LLLYVYVYLPILVDLSYNLIIYENDVTFFYKYLSLIPFQVLSFTKSNYCDFIAKDEWPPVHNPLDHHVWGKCWSLITSCNQSQILFLSLKMHFNWFGLPYQRNPLTIHVNGCLERLQALVSA